MIQVAHPSDDVHDVSQVNPYIQRPRIVPVITVIAASVVAAAGAGARP